MNIYILKVKESNGMAVNFRRSLDTSTYSRQIGHAHIKSFKDGLTTVVTIGDN